MYYCSVLRPPLECVLDPLYTPIPIPRYMHANLQARHCAVPMRICMTGTLPAMTTDEPI